MGLNNCKATSKSEDDYIEEVVCNELELQENGMKVVDVAKGEGKILLVKQHGLIKALGTKCSHYGAPLVTGALGEGRIRCPWHGACFNLDTGDIEDYPGLDSIPSYKVEVSRDGQIKVRAKKSDLVANKRVKCMAKKDLSVCKDTIVIIGAGAAGLVCGETLRQEGFSGRIVLVSAESFLPYDRIKISKMLDANPDNIALRNAPFFKEHDLEIMLNTTAEMVDTQAKTVKLSDGSSLTYSSLFIATGNKSRKVEIEGANLKNVFTLRNLQDAHLIHSAITKTSNVVIYGSSFIGMEVAASCLGKAQSVTVVGRSAVPFQESLGLSLGGRVMKLYLEKGIKFRMCNTVDRFLGDDEGKVREVVLSDTKVLPADLVVMGLGSTPVTEFLPDTVQLNTNGTIPVSEFLETSAPDVWAGGDIVEAPVFGGQKASIGHWGLAHYHGRIAALNILKKPTPLNAVPFFWTMLFGISIRYTGYTVGFDEELQFGDMEKLKCSVYYCKGDTVVAVATVASDPIAAQFAEISSMGLTLNKNHVRAHPYDWWLSLAPKKPSQ